MPAVPEPAFLEPDPALVEAELPRIATYRDVVATPFRKEGLTIRGALYARRGKLIRRSQRIDRRIATCDPDFFVPTREIESVPGKGYYLGHMMQHYGHFITEGISSCWASDEFEVDYFLAHPFKWGKDIPEFARVALRRIGIPPERVRIVERETRFESLVVPDRLWRISRAVNRRFEGIVDRITTGCRRSSPGLKLYLSRSKWPRRSGRDVRNEPEIEEVFQRAGFVVLHPQDHDFLSQLELYSQAAVLAGLAGSALHNAIFCPKGAATISIGDRRAVQGVMRNQLVCGALMGGVTAAIPFAEDEQGFHIPTLARDLAAVLERLGDDPRT